MKGNGLFKLGKRRDVVVEGALALSSLSFGRMRRDGCGTLVSNSNPPGWASDFGAIITLSSSRDKKQLVSLQSWLPSFSSFKPIPNAGRSQPTRKNRNPENKTHTTTALTNNPGTGIPAQSSPGSVCVCYAKLCGY